MPELEPPNKTSKMHPELTLQHIDDLRAKLAKISISKAVQDKWDEAERVRGVYSSNAIEGSTLTHGETEAVLRGATVPGKHLREHIEALNLNHAWLKMQEWAQRPINEQMLLEIHQILLTRVYDEEAGRYRNMPVRITGSDHVPPNAMRVPEKMEEAFKNFQRLEGCHPVEKAADLHASIVTIHPFIDGNGRSARLIQNIALIKAGYWPIVIPVEERARYIATTYESNIGNLIPYREYIIDKVAVSGMERLTAFG